MYGPRFARLSYIERVAFDGTVDGAQNGHFTHTRFCEGIGLYGERDNLRHVSLRLVNATPLVERFYFPRYAV